jgi:hypothetical protein
MAEPNAIRDRYRVDAVEPDEHSYGGVWVDLYQVREPDPHGKPYVGYPLRMRVLDTDLKEILRPGAVVRLTVEPYLGG